MNKDIQIGDLYKRINPTYQSYYIVLSLINGFVIIYSIKSKKKLLPIKRVHFKELYEKLT